MPIFARRDVVLAVKPCYRNPFPASVQKGACSALASRGLKHSHVHVMTVEGGSKSLPRTRKTRKNWTFDSKTSTGYNGDLAVIGAFHLMQHSRHSPIIQPPWRSFYLPFYRTSAPCYVSTPLSVIVRVVLVVAYFRVLLATRTGLPNSALSTWCSRRCLAVDFVEKACSTAC